MTKCCVFVSVLRKSRLSSGVLAMALFLSLTLLTSSAPTGKLLRILHFLRTRSAPVYIMSCKCYEIAWLMSKENRQTTTHTNPVKSATHLKPSCYSKKSHLLMLMFCFYKTILRFDGAKICSKYLVHYTPSNINYFS